MEASAVLTYMTTLAALTLTPGPLVALIAARSAQEDRRGACALALGICAADVVVVIAVSVGFGIWLQAHPGLLSVAKYLGGGYLLWVAWRMWLCSEAVGGAPAPARGHVASVLAGFVICLGNPQTAAVYLALLPRVIDPATVRLADTGLLVLATTIALFGVFLIVILLAGAAQKLLRSPGGALLWGRLMAFAVASSAIWLCLP